MRNYLIWSKNRTTNKKKEIYLLFYFFTVYYIYRRVFTSNVRLPFHTSIYYILIFIYRY